MFMVMHLIRPIVSDTTERLNYLKSLQKEVSEAECASMGNAPDDSSKLKKLKDRISKLFLEVHSGSFGSSLVGEPAIASLRSLLNLYSRVNILTDEAKQLLTEMKQKGWFVLVHANRAEANGRSLKEKSLESEALCPVEIDGQSCSQEGTTHLLAAIYFLVLAEDNLMRAHLIREIYYNSLPQH